ncbi:uncharacterized protein LOC111712742 isoform X2 [Eurytemora carolleeae]|uniref:uncharacterized protein LOC111712742 isoform X2 n=1 Tax=Eurytemora carolleeae TaxID=1294199 RepID=UPI000C7799BD|nr:uncharacterized protein LOC111712742 isoform X2 [Eurytemora carolleeae]|eukprot:XP_023343217.1 uncharacterized protein LOC111712742 isoform X2 [Eurytemora affinis]
MRRILIQTIFSVTLLSVHISGIFGLEFSSSSQSSNRVKRTPDDRISNICQHVTCTGFSNRAGVDEITISCCGWGGGGGGGGGGPSSEEGPPKLCVTDDCTERPPPEPSTTEEPTGWPPTTEEPTGWPPTTDEPSGRPPTTEEPCDGDDDCELIPPDPECEGEDCDDSCEPVDPSTTEHPRSTTEPNTSCEGEDCPEPPVGPTTEPNTSCEGEDCPEPPETCNRSDKIIRCGGPKPTGNRISGGEAAGENEYPFLAYIQYRKKKLRRSSGMVGVATILSDRVLLTSELIFYKIGDDGLPLPALENFDVVVGTDTYTENPDTDKVYKIERIIFSSNDKLQLKIEMKDKIIGAALVITKKPIRFTDYFYPICISHQSGVLVNKSEEGMVAGWGQTGFFLPELRRMQNLRDDGEKVQIQSGRKNKLDSSDGRRIYNLAGKIIPSIDKLLTKEFVLKVWDETWMKDVEKAFRKSGKSKSVVKKFMKTWKHNFLKLKSDAEQAQRILAKLSDPEIAAHFSLSVVIDFLSRGIPVTKKRHALVDLEVRGKDCEKAMKSKLSEQIVDILKHSMICTRQKWSSELTTGGPCYGDEGAPLIFHDSTGTTHLGGITFSIPKSNYIGSFPPDCGCVCLRDEKDYNGIYDAIRNKNWIIQTLKPFKLKICTSPDGKFETLLKM